MSVHIAVFGCPVPALTHPTFSVVASLIRRGYRVTYVTSERFAAEATVLGAEVLRCPRIDSPFNQHDSAAMPIEHQYVHNLVGLAARTFALTLPFYERNKPDLVLYDLSAFAGALVAERIGAPAIRISNQFDFTEATLRAQEVSADWREKVIDAQEDVNRLYASVGAQRRNVILENDDPTLYFYLSDLQLRGSVQGPSVLHAPRCTAERPNVLAWRRPTPRNKPSALVASSTTYNQDPRYYKSCLTELSHLGWETVIAVGSTNTIADFDSLPANCHPIQNIPLSVIMPHVDLIMCAAGMATAMEALYHGIPMLMLTSGHAELEAYAEMFQSRGLGIHLKQPDASPDSVAHCAVRMFESSELRLGVRRSQHALKRSAGAEDAVNWLEERLPPM